MFLYLVLSTLISQLSGSPLPLSSTARSNNLTLSPAPATDSPTNFGYILRVRSIWSIIWSCLATIFACAWVAVHPNIPGPTDSGWKVFKRRLSSMAYALIAPELIVAWALHQHLGARQIKQKFNKKFAGGGTPRVSCLRALVHEMKSWFRDKKIGGDDVVPPWTNTHGFFVQMGGFVLYNNDGVPVEALTYKRLERLIERQQIDIPKIRERSINDKSKHDLISKIFVVLQTCWFITQCGARRGANLPLTELEVVTLAFAILSAITFMLWLDKPHNVLEAIRIDLKPKSGSESYETGPVPSHEDTTASPTARDRSWLHDHLLKDYKRFGKTWYGLLWFVFYRAPYRAITFPLRPMKKLFIDSPSRDPGSHPTGRDSKHKATRVSMFAREHLDNPNPVVVHYLPCLVGALFGSVHIIAWSFSKPGFERWLWRSSTLVTTIQPIISAVVICLTSSGLDEQEQESSGCSILDLVKCILIPLITIPFTVGIPAYVIARVAFMIQAFISLRHLPPEAYLTVPWTSIVPHF